MNNKKLIKISKFLSQHLRHQPENLGLTLAPGGWVVVDDLLAACAQHGFAISRTELEAVVAQNDKQRFAFDATGGMIRANQGHSVAVDLQLEPTVPPDVLYHGTSTTTGEVVLREGLCKMSRHHVHLSPDIDTARRVGMRHGRPVVFAVLAGAMQQAGYVFYVAANGVWLVDHVPPAYLRQLDVDQPSLSGSGLSKG